MTFLKNCLTAGGAAAMFVCMTRTFSGRKPRATFCSATKLRISRPAPDSNTTASAISTTTSAPRVRAIPPPITDRVPPCFRASLKPTLDEETAGSRPNSRLVIMEIPRVYASTGRSILNREHCEAPGTVRILDREGSGHHQEAQGTDRADARTGGGDQGSSRRNLGGPG